MKYKIEGKQNSKEMNSLDLTLINNKIKQTMLGMIESQSVRARVIFHQLNLERKIPKEETKFANILRNIIYVFKPLNRVFQSSIATPAEVQIPDLETIQDIYQDLVYEALRLISKGYVQAKIEENSQKLEGALYVAYEIEINEKKATCILGIDVKNQENIEISS